MKKKYSFTLLEATLLVGKINLPMYKKWSFLLWLCWAVAACTEAGQTSGGKPSSSLKGEVYQNPNAIENDTTKKSIKAATDGKLGNVSVSIQYSSPKVRGRAIWGELVPYDKVWVAGANNATSVEFSQEVEINGVVIEAGKYAFFTIPSAESWTLILNKNWEQHLADKYDPKDNVVRMEVKPQSNVNTERLQYFVEPPTTDADGGISMAWELLKVRMPVKAKS